MKTVQELSRRKVVLVRIDLALASYQNQVLLPEKLEKPNRMLQTARLPAEKLPA